VDPANYQGALSAAAIGQRRLGLPPRCALLPILAGMLPRQGSDTHGHLNIVAGGTAEPPQLTAGPSAGKSENRTAGRSPVLSQPRRSCACPCRSGSRRQRAFLSRLRLLAAARDPGKERNLTPASGHVIRGPCTDTSGEPSWQ
jgi:hypothetical protein